jgi:hypothetical protein
MPFFTKHAKLRFSRKMLDNFRVMNQRVKCQGMEYRKKYNQSKRLKKFNNGFVKKKL